MGAEKQAGDRRSVLGSLGSFGSHIG